MKQCEIDMLLSLYDAIRKVGGNPQHILVKDLTVIELIEQLSPNGIAFTVKEK